MMFETGQQTPAAGRWVLALTSVASFMVALDVLVVTTALATVREDLHTSVGALEWTLTAYNVCLAGFMMTAAALGDRFGRRRMMIVGIAAFTAGSAISALSPAIGWLIAGRVVQGVGAALVAPLALPLLSAAYEPDRRGRALGILVGVTGLATFAGPLIGGGIAQALSWQWIFWVNVPIGLALIPLVRSKVTESHGPNGRIDVAGNVLVTAALVAVAWGLVRAVSVGWSAPEVLATLATGLLLGGCFLWWEHRAHHPMLDVALFRSRSFSATNAATVCHSAVVLGAVFLMGQFLQAELGVGSFGAGLRLLPWTGSMMLVAPLTGRLSDRIGTRPVICAGLMLAAAGNVWLAWLARPGVTYAELVAPLLIVGVGNSSVFPALSSAVSASVDRDHIGPASGVNNTLAEIGGVLGIAVVALAFAAAGSFATPNTVAKGFHTASWLCAAICLAGALAGALTPPRPRPSDAGPISLTHQPIEEAARP
jgi:EmrB/QacA subfamily drug resistance transporter